MIQGKTQAELASLRAQIQNRPKAPRIAVLIDRHCFSSCMNFVLEVRAISGTAILGEPTRGYSPFGEIREVHLPSGQGRLYVPSTWYPSLFQEAREPFVPHAVFDGNMADDSALKDWVGRTLFHFKTRH